MATETIDISDMKRLGDASLDSSQVTPETLEKNSLIFYYAAGNPTPLAKTIWENAVKPNLKCKGDGCKKNDFYGVVNKSNQYSEGPIESCACHDCDDTACGGLGWYINLRNISDYMKLMDK